MEDKLRTTEGFNLLGFAKAVALGGVMEGLGSAAFYGVGKGLESLWRSVKGNKGKIPESKYTTAKLQHEYKHAGDFGIKGNWNGNNAKLYQEAIQNHIDTAPEIYKSVYRGQAVYVYLNRITSVGAYIDMNGNYIGGWKFNANQINYHVTHGIKIK